MSLTPLSYSLVILYDECIYAIRDPFGNRPLCIGALVPPNTPHGVENLNINNVDGKCSETILLNTQLKRISSAGWVISSESCSFPSVCAQIFRDVMPGEIVKLEKYKMPRTLAMVPRPDGKHRPQNCHTNG